MKHPTKHAFDEYRMQVPRRQRYRHAGKTLTLNVYLALQLTQYALLIIAIANLALSGQPTITVWLGVATAFFSLLRYFSLSLQRPWFWISAGVEVGIPAVIVWYFIPSGDSLTHFIGMAIFAFAFRYNAKGELYVNADGFEAFVKQMGRTRTEGPPTEATGPDERVEQPRWDEERFRQMLEKPASQFTREDIWQLENADRLLTSEENDYFSEARPRFVMSAGSECKGTEMAEQLLANEIAKKRAKAAELLQAARHVHKP